MYNDKETLQAVNKVIAAMEELNQIAADNTTASLLIDGETGREHYEDLKILASALQKKVSKAEKLIPEFNIQTTKSENTAYIHIHTPKKPVLVCMYCVTKHNPQHIVHRKADVMQIRLEGDLKGKSIEALRKLKKNTPLIRANKYNEILRNSIDAIIAGN